VYKDDDELADEKMSYVWGSKLGIERLLNCDDQDEELAVLPLVT